MFRKPIVGMSLREVPGRRKFASRDQQGGAKRGEEEMKGLLYNVFLSVFSARREMILGGR